MLIGDGRTIPRFFYHRPPRGIRKPDGGGIRSYRNRGYDGSTPHIEAAFGRRDPEIIWLSPTPIPGYGEMIVVDVSMLDVSNIRHSGQCEGNIWHLGDIPAEAIVGITKEVF